MDNDSLTALLRRHSYIELAILFGSRASGRARPDSDLDLALWAHAPLTQQEKEMLITEIAGLCGSPIDLIDLRSAGEPLLGQILQGIRLIDDPDLFARLLTRHLIDQADFVPLQQRILQERRDEWLR